MEVLQTVLPILVDILLVVFLVICIILGIKAIKVMDKFNALVEQHPEWYDEIPRHGNRKVFKGLSLKP